MKSHKRVVQKKVTLNGDAIMQMCMESKYLSLHHSKIFLSLLLIFPSLENNLTVSSLELAGRDPFQFDSLIKPIKVIDSISLGEIFYTN